MGEFAHRPRIQKSSFTSKTAFGKNDECKFLRCSPLAAKHDLLNAEVVYILP